MELFQIGMVKWKSILCRTEAREDHQLLNGGQTARNEFMLRLQNVQSDAEHRGGERNTEEEEYMRAQNSR